MISARRLVAPDLHRMGGDVPGKVLAMADRLTDHLGQMLVQGAAAGDVEHLHAAADGQDRQPALVGGANEVDLEGVELRLGRSDPAAAFRAVAGRIDVRATGQADAVRAIQQRGEALGGHRRGDHGDPARRLDRLQVAQPEHHLVPRRLALGDLHDAAAAQLRGADHDQRRERLRPTGRRWGPGTRCRYSSARTGGRSGPRGQGWGAAMRRRAIRPRRATPPPAA